MFRQSVTVTEEDSASSTGGLSKLVATRGDAQDVLDVEMVQ